MISMRRILTQPSQRQLKRHPPRTQVRSAARKQQFATAEDRPFARQGVFSLQINRQRSGNALVAELPSIASADAAAAWARHNLSAKNTLTAEDAQIVEEQSQTTLSRGG
jgi:hypothetical protein